ncbi:gastrula zinc finger protein XlCGF8.2DB-like [Phycodurus eques]|uniref:gastrula zinc finger protein XlCGF8.2DB-like n=1 Tax=Phycodurus eques TaxID=693459 RepID=UPI002ACD51CA|nr:gastrula zinc finger protein XlCGF8.2DB-like [Phycodurus eques]
MASTEEQVCRAREERELRRRQQLQAAHKVLHNQDVQQLIGHLEELPPQLHVGSSSLEQDHLQHPHVKEEEEDTDVSKLPLTVIAVKTDDSEDEPPESVQLHHRSQSEDPWGRPPPDKLLAPLSDTDDAEDMNDADCEGDNKPLKCFKKKTGGSCSICGKAFAQNGPMIRHMRTHTGEKPFTCSVCGKGFTNKSDMVRHMRTHTGEKPFNCSLCEKRFTHKESLVAHMRTHTGEKPFICSVCGKTFTQNSSMVAHMRIHTGEKPYSCSVCGKRFILKPNMVSHMRTHSGEKPYSCSVCDKTFSFKSCVVTHMRTHTGEKPFRCSLCGERYAQRANLTAHKRIHNTE